MPLEISVVGYYSCMGMMHRYNWYYGLNYRHNRYNSLMDYSLDRSRMLDDMPREYGERERVIVLEMNNISEK